jgi:hypothetical protein
MPDARTQFAIDQLRKVQSRGGAVSPIARAGQLLSGQPAPAPEPTSEPIPTPLGEAPGADTGPLGFLRRLFGATGGYRQDVNLPAPPGPATSALLKRNGP